MEAVELALASPVLHSLTLNSSGRGLLSAASLAVEADGLEVAPASAGGTGVLRGLTLAAALLHGLTLVGLTTAPPALAKWEGVAAPAALPAAAS